jgi:peptidoglycan/LPS O-acetylase OafA/YrhL
MSHTAVIWTVNQVFRVVLKRPVLFLGDRMTPQLSALETIAAYAFVVICVLLVSQATFTLVENPLRQKSRKLIAAHG